MKPNTRERESPDLNRARVFEVDTDQKEVCSSHSVALES